YALIALLPNLHVRAQHPIDLDKHNEPQPDLVVARKTRAYKLRHPLPPDVLLVIEVSDSSLREDRRGKIPRYARAGIPEAWIVDVGRERIHAFSEPAGITYQRETTHNRGEVVHSAAIPSLRLPVEAAFD
ncbi:MAG: Uma2 family endonuclease, partial [Gammaproteobacteria bacterium]|nr:Uma2 family endonuclease [Gammaproteobacteria bacterium]